MNFWSAFKTPDSALLALMSHMQMLPSSEVESR